MRAAACASGLSGVPVGRDRCGRLGKRGDDGSGAVRQVDGSGDKGPLKLDKGWFTPVALAASRSTSLLRWQAHKRCANSQCSVYADNGFARSRFKRTLPNPDDHPACFPQGAICSLVASPIPRDFTAPKRCVRLWRSESLRISMPKISVNEYYDSFL